MSLVWLHPTHNCSYNVHCIMRIRFGRWVVNEDTSGRWADWVTMSKRRVSKGWIGTHVKNPSLSKSNTDVLKTVNIASILFFSFLWLKKAFVAFTNLAKVYHHNCPCHESLPCKADFSACKLYWTKSCIYWERKDFIHVSLNTLKSNWFRNVSKLWSARLFTMLVTFQNNIYYHFITH